MTGGHYFDPLPAAASRRRLVRLVLPDVSLELETDAGVFSAERVDPGTKLLLLDGPPIAAADSPVLDLGCGYGAIAVTLARRAPAAEVWAIDVNERARGLCAANAARNHVGNVHVVGPDEVPDDLRFGAIWSNPPIRIGKEQLHRLLGTWLARLRPGGTAHLVVQKHLGADSLARWLDAQAWPTRRRASRAGYRLLDVGPRESPV